MTAFGPNGTQAPVSREAAEAAAGYRQRAYQEQAEHRHQLHEAHKGRRSFVARVRTLLTRRS